MEQRMYAIRPHDVAAARALVSDQLSGTPYESRMLEQLDIAIGGDDPECRAMVAIAPDAEEVDGVLLYGTVAGARGVVKIHALAASTLEAARALAASVLAQCTLPEGRMIIYEVPDDPLSHVTARAMRELGFEDEGRIADFVRDGVDLLILVWRSR